MGRVQMANFNAPGQIVVSGDLAAVIRAGEIAMARGAKRVVPLNVSGAWHSELMRPARARFAPFVERAVIEQPRFTVVSNVDAQPYRDVAHIRRNLVESLTAEVLWHDTALRLLAENLDALVEFGASPVLLPLARRLPNPPRLLQAGDVAGWSGCATRSATRARHDVRRQGCTRYRCEPRDRQGDRNRVCA